MQGHKENKSRQTGIRNNTLKLSVWQLKGRNGSLLQREGKRRKTMLHLLRDKRQEADDGRLTW